MTLSRTSQYALRAALHLAREPADRLARAGEVAEALGVPSNYLSKILHAMTRAGLLVSERGPTGGFRLARPADEMPLADIVATFDELGGDRRCLLGRPECLDASPCAAHAHWKEVAERVHDFFEETTVADLLGTRPPRDLEPVPAGGPHGRNA